MNRLLVTLFISTLLALPSLASEKLNQPATPAPAGEKAPEAPKADAKIQSAKDEHHKTREEKRTERKAAREEKKKEHMADAAKKCADSITETEASAKDMTDGEAKDMSNHFIAHAKIEAEALKNPNMTSHWNQHQRKCTSYVKKAKAQIKRHPGHDKAKAGESTTATKSENSTTTKSENSAAIMK